MSPLNSTGNSIKRRALRWVLWSTAFLLFVATLFSISWNEVQAALGKLDASEIVILVALNLLALFIFSGRWWILLWSFEEKISWVYIGCYRLVGFGISYFTPGPQFGGEPVQVLLLERRHHIQRDTAVASVGLDKLIELLINCTVLGAGLLVLLESNVVVRMPAVHFVAVFVIMLSIYILAIWKGRCPATFFVKWLPREIRDVVWASERAAHRALSRNARYFAIALGFSFMSWAVIFGEYWLMASFLGVRLTFCELLIGITAARVAYLFLFPAGLGVFEAGQAFAWHLMGFSPALGIVMSLLIRLRDTMLGGLGLATGTHLLRRY